jgi:hypothetical protein
MQKVRLTKPAWKLLTNKTASHTTLFRDLRSAGVFFVFSLYFCLGLRRVTLSSAGVTLVEILRFLEILQRILRGIYFGKCGTG